MNQVRFLITGSGVFPFICTKISVSGLPIDAVPRNTNQWATLDQRPVQIKSFWLAMSLLLPVTLIAPTLSLAGKYCHWPLLFSDRVIHLQSGSPSLQRHRPLSHWHPGDSHQRGLWGSPCLLTAVILNALVRKGLLSPLGECWRGADRCAGYVWCPTVTFLPREPFEFLPLNHARKVLESQSQ